MYFQKIQNNVTKTILPNTPEFSMSIVLLIFGKLKKIDVSCVIVYWILLLTSRLSNKSHCIKK